MKKAVMVGQRFGRLTVKRLFDVKNGNRQWLCKCDCGNECLAISARLNDGHVTSCGCKQQEKRAKGNPTHGLSKTRLYVIWCQMKSRCNNPKSTNYARWGGRGIKICNEWQNDFSAFQKWADANGYNDSLSIDRINVDGNYEPDNCRWADRKTQCRNRSYNRKINGKCLAEISEETGLSSSAILARIKTGWTEQEAISTPKREQKRC